MCTSKPKVPKAAPVIQRQAYKSPAPRESLSSGDASAGASRRRIPGLATSAQGDASTASTTRSAFGGDAINPVIGGGGGASTVSAPPAIGAVVSPVTAAVQAYAANRAKPMRTKFGNLGGVPIG